MASKGLTEPPGVRKLVAMAYTPWSNVKCVDQESGTLAHEETPSPSSSTLSLFTFLHWRRKWQPTPVFSPGESQGRGSLVGCRLWGRTESDTGSKPQEPSDRLRNKKLNSAKKILSHKSNQGPLLILGL